MADLVVIADPDEAIAEPFRKRVLDLPQGGPIELGDAAIAVKQADAAAQSAMRTN